MKRMVDVREARELCQVFQTSTEVDQTDIDEELFERLKNKERDPMSMSFYQEKDDDTCERLGGYEPPVDLNAVHPLPDAVDDDNSNDFMEKIDYNDKENTNPEHILLETAQHFDEPNNDIIKFDDIPVLTNNAINLSQVDNINEYIPTGVVDAQGFTNIDFECANMPQEIVQTDTPESHKLLFEQIPEIPDGKTSELGFTGEDILEGEDDKEVRPLSSQDESSQDCEMESKTEELPVEPEFEQILTKEISSPVPEKMEEFVPVQSKTPEPVQTQEEIEIPVNRDNVVDDLINADSEFNNVVENVITENEPEFNVNKEEENKVDSNNMLMSDIEPCMDTLTDDMLIPQVVSDIKEEAVSASPLPSDVPLPPESPHPDDTHEHIRSPVSSVVSASPQPAQSPLPVQEPEIPETIESELALSPTPVHMEYINVFRKCFLTYDIAGPSIIWQGAFLTYLIDLKAPTHIGLLWVKII